MKYLSNGLHKNKAFIPLEYNSLIKTIRKSSEGVLFLPTDKNDFKLTNHDVANT